MLVIIGHEKELCQDSVYRFSKYNFVVNKMQFCYPQISLWIIRDPQIYLFIQQFAASMKDENSDPTFPLGMIFSMISKSFMMFNVPLELSKVIERGLMILDRLGNDFNP
ncbi:MAG: hypothetical protein K9K64_14325 [Desulfohalobiaceae bacterium]|nr:hypothetical protein [Desulfohalobiaceae bacterium]